MSENTHGADGSEEWEKMLRSLLGDKTAEDIINSLGAQGINPNDQINKMLNGQNFTLISHQLQSILGSPSTDAVNWIVAEKVARDLFIKKNHKALTASEGEIVRNALSTASLWLDAATDLGATTSAHQAWTPLDWITHSLPTFKTLMEPVGANIGRSLADRFELQIEQFPDEMQGILPKPTNLLDKLTSWVIGMQYGVALAELADSSFGTADTGLPLIQDATAALIPPNIAKFAKELDVEQAEVLAYIAVRETAAARLYAQVPWLRARIIDTVAEFAKGIEIDTSSIEEQLQDLSTVEPTALQEIDLSGIFTLSQTPQQQELLNRLEHLISLVEGWVSEVSARAVAPHLQHAIPLREMFNRRYATDNPAKQVWEKQFGMQLAPRQLRAATRFWQMAEMKLGIAQRDALWAHPDLLPNPEMLTEPEKFFNKPQETDIEQELNSFLDELFATDTDTQTDIPHEPKFDTTDDT